MTQNLTANRRSYRFRNPARVNCRMGNTSFVILCGGFGLLYQNHVQFVKRQRLLHQGRPGILPGHPISRQMVCLLELSDSGHRLSAALAVNNQVSTAVHVHQVLQRLHVRADRPSLHQIAGDRYRRPRHLQFILRPITANDMLQSPLTPGDHAAIGLRASVTTRDIALSGDENPVRDRPARIMLRLGVLIGRGTASVTHRSILPPGVTQELLEAPET